VKPFTTAAKTFSAILAVAAFSLALYLYADDPKFHNAPDEVIGLKNPFAGQAAAEAGGKLYAANCAICHGQYGQGTGEIPALMRGPAQAATDGEVYWFITTGSLNSGMPSWQKLPEKERWELVTFVKSLPTARRAPPKRHAVAPAAPSASISLPAPPKPFTDFRFEEPGASRNITVADLPEAHATKSAENGAPIVERPKDVLPKAPPGFQVELFATGLDNPRVIRTAPNGDIFVGESAAGKIEVSRGITREHRPEQIQEFATGLNQPYGIAFYPPGPNPEWVYIGDTDEVLRFPYRNGDLTARGASQHIAEVPPGGGHWTRDIQFSPDGKKMYVAVGSRSNNDDSDNNPEEKNRADILEFDPDGTAMRIYAHGIRNAGGGLAIQPETGQLWCSVNERDTLGDNLVPDYITHVQEGGFYGWPWWYMGGHQDPRHLGKHPELKDKVIVPDVLLQPHNATLQLTFYEGKQFPAEYQGDIFASEHGSWNRSVRTGYEVIRVPLHHTGRASGEYEDFLTGFVLPNGNVWGRPVGVTVAADGSLLVTDDGSDSIWRVTWTGKSASENNNSTAGADSSGKAE
jgi:glucose/arabinose dehydrogenase/mono/diheme cytochrome c family protein